jgi:hypothetical protein
MEDNTRQSSNQVEVQNKAVSQKMLIQNELKSELETLSGKTISNSDAWEAHYNLSGFFRVLEQMKKES